MKNIDTGEKKKYQPSGDCGTHSPPGTTLHLLNTKWQPGDLKMADEVWKGLYPLVFECF